MRAGGLVVLVLALPTGAEPPPPSPELAARLQQLEALRPDIEARRTRAAALRVGAYVGYALALVGAGWALGELIASSRSGNPVPLGGVPRRPVVPPEVMALSGLGFALGAVALHVISRVLDNSADHDEADLEEDERRFRRSGRAADNAPP